VGACSNDSLKLLRLERSNLETLTEAEEEAHRDELRDEASDGKEASQIKESKEHKEGGEKEGEGLMKCQQVMAQEQMRPPQVMETVKEEEAIDVTTPEDETGKHPSAQLPIQDTLSPELPLAQPDPCSPDAPFPIHSSSSLRTNGALKKKRKPLALPSQDELTAERTKMPKLLPSKSFPLHPSRPPIPSPPPLSSSRSTPLPSEASPLINDHTPLAARAALLALLGRY
jgi:hypothetical protein